MRLRTPLVAVAVALAACSGGQTSTSPVAEPGVTPASEASGTSTADTDSLTCWTAPAGDGGGGVVFADVTETTGLVEPLTGMYGHAAIWTDVDGDLTPDLYVGTFADRDAEEYRFRGADGPSPDRLLLGDQGGFHVDQTLPEAWSRTSGGIGADLDGDGDLDMVISRNTDEPQPGQDPTEVLENVAGSLEVVADSGLAADLGGRSVATLDFDRDGLIDLFIAEDRFAGGSSVLYHNDGGLHFTDVTSPAGIPEGVHGLGVATADFDGDSLTDIFVSGSNRLFLADGAGKFAEAESDVFTWETYGDEDDIAGISVADVDRDGDLDIALGQHYNSTLEFGERVPVRLYLNLGAGEFRDVTEESGLTGLPTKAPHVELNDFDNDGWPDLLTSASAAGGPALFVNRGLENGIPRFDEPGGLGDAQYWVSAPSADFDRDGRLDVFLLEWEPALPSLLLHNETDGGNWVEVSVGPDHGFGLGWRVEVRDDTGLIGARDITVTQGYSAGVLPVAHFGLGDADEVSVRLIAPGGTEDVTLDGVTANQRLRWPDGCG